MARSLLQPRCIGFALAIAFMLGCFPTGVEAKMVGSMASGAQELTPRQAREAQIHRLLSEAKVAKALESAGLTPEQVRSRLDRLDGNQLEELAKNLETIKAGKGTIVVLGVLVLILVGVLIYMQIEEA